MKIPTITLKKAAPYLVAVVLFIAFSMVYFAPQYNDKALPMSDMQQVEGMSHDIHQHIDEYGENPQWTGGMFGGMPSYLIWMNYDGRLPMEVGNTLFFLGEPAAYFFVAMLSFFFMLLCFGVNPWLAIVGALGYGLSTYFYLIIYVGHITKMIALAFGPALIGSIFLTYRRNMLLGGALTAFFAAVELSANHIQVTYYFLFIIIALFFNELVRAVKIKAMPHFWKATAILFGAAILSIGANFSQLYYIGTHSAETMRGGSEITTHLAGAQTSDKGLDLAYATQWSYGTAETFNLFIPNFVGGSSNGGFSADGEVAHSLQPYNATGLATQLPAYWGTQPFTAGPVYIGAVLIFLFVLGMFILKGQTKWWIFGVTFLSILLAWGHNFMWLTEFFYNYVPFYNKFRTPSMILVIAEFTIPLLAIFTLQGLMSGTIDKKRVQNGLRSAVIITAGIALYFIMFSGNTYNFSSPADSQVPLDVATAMRSERVTLLRNDAIRSLLFVLLSAFFVMLWYRGKIKNWLAISLMALLIVSDITPVNLRYLNYDSFQPKAVVNKIQPTQADLYIMQDAEPGYRVANFSVNTFSDGLTSNFHRSVGGYHPAKLSRYQDVIDRYLSRGEMGIYNMLNTKYVIVVENQQPVAKLNQMNLGAAWFVNNIAFTKSAFGELERIGEVDLSTTAVVDEQFSKEVVKDIKYDSLRTISLVDYKVNELTYKYSTTQDDVAVFSEIYYPAGWKAYIDGVETPHFRANYILRAMSLPAGDHTVVFKYKAPNFELVTTITYVFSSLLLLLVLAAIVRVIVLKRKNNVSR